MGLKLLLMVPLFMGCHTMKRRPLPERSNVVIQRGFDNNEGGIELRGGDSGYKLRPVLGLSQYHGLNKAWFLYGAVRYEIFLSPSWTISPNVGVGYYKSNGELDLGGNLEFRSAVDLAYMLTKNLEVGVGVSHISNSGLYDENPGLDSVVLQLAWGF